jgi:hypothetical protein
VKVRIVTDEEKKQRRATIRKKRQQRGRKAGPLPRPKTGADNAYQEFRVVHFYNEGLFGAPADAHDETPGEGKEGWFQYAFCDGARLHRKLWFQKHLKEQSRSRLRGTC